MAMSNPVGKKHRNSKLTDVQVVEVLKRAEAGEQNVELPWHST